MIREIDRAIALSQAIVKAVKAGLTRSLSSRNRRVSSLCLQCQEDQDCTVSPVPRRAHPASRGGIRKAGRWSSKSKLVPDARATRSLSFHAPPEPRTHSHGATFPHGGRGGASGRKIASEYRALVLSAAYLGCRWGELVGLQRGNLHLSSVRSGSLGPSRKWTAGSTMSLRRRRAPRGEPDGSPVPSWKFSPSISSTHPHRFLSS